MDNDDRQIGRFSPGARRSRCSGRPGPLFLSAAHPMTPAPQRRREALRRRHSTPRGRGGVDEANPAASAELATVAAVNATVTTPGCVVRPE